MKLFVQALAAVAFTAISSFVQGQQHGQRNYNGSFYGVGPATTSDELKVFTGMKVTAVWAEGTPDLVNGVGLYYIDKDGKERAFSHGVAKPKNESMILGEGEYVNSINVYDETLAITYVEFTTNMKNHTSAGTKRDAMWSEIFYGEHKLVGFRSNLEQGKLIGFGGLWVSCQDSQKCS